MIIVCEKCSAKFNLESSLLSKMGSKVRCSQCKHLFTAYPEGYGPEAEASSADPEPAAPPQPPPSPQEKSPEPEPVTPAVPSTDAAEPEPDKVFESDPSPASPEASVEDADTDIDFDPDLDLDLDLDFTDEETDTLSDVTDDDLFGELDPKEPEAEPPAPVPPPKETGPVDIDGDPDFDLDLDFDDPSPTAEPDKTGDHKPVPPPAADGIDDDLDLDFDLDLDDDTDFSDPDDADALTALDDDDFALDLDLDLDDDPLDPPTSAGAEAAGLGAHVSDPDEEEFSLELDLDLDDSESDWDAAASEVAGENDEDDDELTLELDLDDDPFNPSAHFEGQEDLSKMQDDEDESDTEDLEAVDDPADLDEALASESSGTADLDDDFFDTEQDDPPKGSDEAPGPEKETEPQKEILTAPKASEPGDDTPIAGSGFDSRADEDTPLPATPPPARKGSPIVKLFLVFILLLLLFIGAYVGAVLTGTTIPYLSDLKIPYITDLITPPKPEKPAPIRISPDKKSISGRFETNDAEGTLFVITGNVINHSQVVCKNIRVKGALITKDNKTAKVKTVVSGDTITDQELAVMTMADIDARLTKPASLQKSILGPGRSKPFMIVFSKLPDNLENFTVTVEGFDRQ